MKKCNIFLKHFLNLAPGSYEKSIKSLHTCSSDNFRSTRILGFTIAITEIIFGIVNLIRDVSEILN